MRLSAKAKERLQTNPAQFIKQQIKEFMRTSLANRLSFMNGYVMWNEPLVKFADGNAPIFTEYKSIIAPTHLSPREALAKAYNKSPGDMPARLSVISWVLPVVEETRKSNRAEMRVPSRLWSHTRWYGEKFNEKLRAYIVGLLTGMGYLTVAPMLQPYFETYSNAKGPYSNWSERHVAYAAGHGTFGLSGGLITERGIAHRCGNVVTHLVLPASRMTTKGPYSNCLFYQGINCRACINRCPAEAITEKGHDKNKCLQYMYDISYSAKPLKNKYDYDYPLVYDYDNDRSLAGCGLCQVKVPCEFQNPPKKLKGKWNK